MDRTIEQIDAEIKRYRRECGSFKLQGKTLVEASDQLRQEIHLLYERIDELPYCATVTDAILAAGLSKLGECYANNERIAAAERLRLTQKAAR